MIETTDSTPTAGAPGSAFVRLEETMLELLDALEEKERVERIDDLLHRLNFERRLTLLAPNQREAMNNRSLTEHDRKKIDACTTEQQRERVFQDLARTQYFRDCAWIDYLNGGTDVPPTPPNKVSA